MHRKCLLTQLHDHFRRGRSLKLCTSLGYGRCKFLDHSTSAVVSTITHNLTLFSFHSHRHSMFVNTFHSLTHRHSNLVKAFLLILVKPLQHSGYSCCILTWSSVVSIVITSTAIIVLTALAILTYSITHMAHQNFYSIHVGD